MKRVIGAVIVVLLSLYLVKVGIMHKDHIETEFNANILCLSCIGIE